MVERLKKLIKQKGLSLSAVEKELRFGNGAIKRFSTNSPSADKILKLSNFLNVSTDYLLKGFDGDSTSSEGVKKLICIYNKLDERGRDILIGKASEELNRVEGKTEFAKELSPERLA